MKQKFKAIVNQTFEFSLLQSAIEKLDFISDKNSVNVIYNHTSREIEIIETDFYNRTYTLKINGNVFTVKLENELDFLISEMGLSLGSASIANEINAPMPGLILEVNVSEGKEIKEGETLCVLEAMKMENALTAPRDGVVKTVNMKKGDAVEKGMLLIELES